jgi:ABC-type lipoprotein export system ATPase subunit
MPENHSYIRLEGLSKGYQESGHIRTVLRGADAEFARGGFVAILGKSGSTNGLAAE